MTLVQAIVLGLVQGLSEFLPISSSGHLVLVPQFLGWSLDGEEAFIFFVLVQWGTLLSVFAYFWKDLIAIGRAMLTSLRNRQEVSGDAKLGWLILLATLPALAAGLLFRDQIEATFNDPVATGFFLLGTAVMLTLAELLGKRNLSMEDIGTREALAIGLFQAIALFPGISRSGATITGGMMSNLRRRAAARFSFLMSVPVMISAGVLALFELSQLPKLSDFLPSLAIGFLVSTIVGFLAIRWLLNYLSTRSLFPFAAYCALIGLLTIFSS